MSKATRQSHGIDGLMTMTISGSINNTDVSTEGPGPQCSLKQNHNQILARGSEEYILSYRENTLAALPTTGKTGAAKWVIPQMWEREWNPRLGLSVTPLDFNIESSSTKLSPLLWLKPEEISLDAAGTDFIDIWTDSSAQENNFGATIGGLAPPYSVNIPNGNKFRGADGGATGSGSDNYMLKLEEATDFDLDSNQSFVSYFTVRLNAPFGKTGMQTLLSVGSANNNTNFRISVGNFVNTIGDDRFGDIRISTNRASNQELVTWSNKLSFSDSPIFVIGVGRKTDNSLFCRVNGIDQGSPTGSTLDESGDLNTDITLLSTISGSDEIEPLDGTLLEVLWIKETSAATAGSNFYEVTGAIEVDKTITITSTNNVVKTYISKASGTNGDLDGSGNVIFESDSSTETQINNFIAAINSSNGHNAGSSNSVITVLNVSNTAILMTQLAGSAGNTAIVENSATFNPFPAGGWTSSFKGGTNGIWDLDLFGLESYLTYKYNILLPSDHLYKNGMKTKSAIEATI